MKFVTTFVCLSITVMNCSIPAFYQCFKISINIASNSLSKHCTDGSVAWVTHKCIIIQFFICIFFFWRYTNCQKTLSSNMTSLAGFQYTPENMQRLEKVSLKNFSDTRTGKEPRSSHLSIDKLWCTGCTWVNLLHVPELGNESLGPFFQTTCTWLENFILNTVVSMRNYYCWLFERYK